MVLPRPNYNNRVKIIYLNPNSNLFTNLLNHGYSFLFIYLFIYLFIHLFLKIG